MSRRTAALLVAGSIALVPPGAAAPQHFGYALERVTDLDGDGLEDFAASAPDVRFGADGHGAVYLFSTRTLERLGTIPGSGYFGTSLSLIPPAPIWPKGALAITSTCRGLSVASLHDLRVHWSAEDQCEHTSTWIEADRLGDVDHDGVADLVVARPWAEHDERLRAYSGLTGRRIWSSLPAGAYVGFARMATTRDRDGDGVREVWLVTAREHECAAPFLQLELVSGATGNALSCERIPDPLGQDLRALAALPDLDGDGVEELAIGLGEDVCGPTYPEGRVLVVSGASGALATTLVGEPYESEFGNCLAVSRLGDAPRWLVGAHDSCFRPDQGSIALFEHLSTPSIARVEDLGSRDCGFAWSATFLPDRDGDGWEELVVSNIYGPCGSDSAGRVTIHDGRNLRELCPVAGF